MAARSLEPANRRASPQSFRASGAGRRRSRMSARTSMAPATRAAGVMRKILPSRARENPHSEDDPHNGQHQHAETERRSTHTDIIGCYVDEGMNQPACDEDP